MKTTLALKAYTLIMAAEKSSDAIQSVGDSAKSIFAWLQPCTWVAVAAAVLVCGILCVAGGQEGREKAKKWMPWIAIGSILILGAVQLGQGLLSNISFGA